MLRFGDLAFDVAQFETGQHPKFPSSSAQRCHFGTAERPDLWRTGVDEQNALCAAACVHGRAGSIGPTHGFLGILPEIKAAPSFKAMAGQGRKASLSSRYSKTEGA
jgi:hypothetical protein